MFKRSMIEVASEILTNKKGSLSFNELWKKTSSMLEMSEEEKQEYVSRFYTDLSIDSRFVLLEDNFWDLRENHEFSKIHIDMNEAYSELDEEEKELVGDEEIEDESDEDSEEEEDEEEEK